MRTPALSVVMPVYNCESYLSQTIESILNQTFSDYEFIIVNDGSTDGSGAIVDYYAAADDRINVIHQKNTGVSLASNVAMQHARAPLIARMDGDDVALPNRFAMQIEAFAQDPDLAILGASIEIIDTTGNTIEVREYPRSHKAFGAAFERGCPLAHPVVMMKRDLILSLGGYRKQFQYGEDYDLWLRAYEKGFKLDNLPTILLKYRVNPAGLSHTYATQQQLAPVIAYVTHKMRVAGVADPVQGEGVVSAQVIDDLPAHYKMKAKSLLLDYEYQDIMNANSAEINTCMMRLDQMVLEIDPPTFMRIRFKAITGLFRQRMILSAFKCLSETLRNNPFNCISYIFLYFSRMLCRLFIYNVKCKK